MKLYYSPGACSLADHIALAEADLPYEIARVDLKEKRVEDEQDYTSINPKGYVPALELDDGEILTENLAILSWIGSQASALMPAEGMAHWRTLETLAFISTEVHKSYKPFFKSDASDEEKTQAADVLGKRFATLAKQLEDGDFLMGDAISVADAYLFVMLMWARKNGVAVAAGLDGYFDRLKARPAFVRALREEGLD